MDVLTHRLAVQMLETAYQPETVDLFEEANRVMLAHLGDLAVDSLHRETEVREQNTTLLRDIMGHFPHAEPRKPFGSVVEFKAQTPADFTTIKANTLWAFGLGDEEGTPYYVIGERVIPVPDGTKRRFRYPQVELLLWQANGDAQRRGAVDPLSMSNRFVNMSLMTTGRAYLHEYLALEQKQLRYAVQPDPDDFENAYDHHSRSATIGSQQGFKAASIGGHAPLKFNGDMQDAQDLEELGKRIRTLNMPRSYGSEFKDGISNEVLAKFDVFRHIIKLAQRFSLLQSVGRAIVAVEPEPDQFA